MSTDHDRRKRVLVVRDLVPPGIDAGCGVGNSPLSLAGLEVRNTALLRQLAAATKMVAAAQGREEFLRGEVLALTGKLDDSETRLTDNETKLTASQAKLTAAVEQIEHLSKLVGEAAAAMEEGRKHTEALASRLKAVELSKSWRLTAPLRRLRRALS